MSLQDAIAELRALGIRSIELEPAGRDGYPLSAPTEPAGFEPEPEEAKPAGSCVAPGCLAPGGFHYAPAYCHEHGLAQFNVRGG